MCSSWHFSPQRLFSRRVGTILGNEEPRRTVLENKRWQGHCPARRQGWPRLFSRHSMRSLATLSARRLQTSEKPSCPNSSIFTFFSLAVVMEPEGHKHAAGTSHEDIYFCFQDTDRSHPIKSSPPGVGTSSATPFFFCCSTELNLPVLLEEECSPFFDTHFENSQAAHAV